MKENPIGAKREAVHRLRVVERQPLGREIAQDVLDDADGGSDLPGHAAPGSRAPAELGFAIADILGAAEDRADVVLEIPGHVQSEVRGGIRDAGDRAPDDLVVGKELELSPEPFELPDEET